MRWVWRFDEGSADQRDLLGGKGANLAEMTKMGLPVPPGFTITTEACNAVLAAEGVWPAELEGEIRESLADLESRTGRTFGGGDDPLLLSVRSGAKFSMPGMMDTVLDLGMTPEVEQTLAATTGDPHFAADARRRFVEMFGSVVLNVPDDHLRRARAAAAEAADVTDVAMLDVEALHELTDAFEKLIAEHGDRPLPWDPFEQLRLAVDAVFRSWNGKRARDYRRFEKIPDDLGTAVNVQTMVFGNTGETSGTGVAFTRDPSTGDAHPTGDFLINAQGEDVVAGIRHTRPLSELRDVLPDAADELDRIMATLEQHYREMCDIEFTIDRGKLWMLQTRTGKRTAAAAARIAVDMVDEGLIDEREAVRRFTPTHLDRLQHPRIDPDAAYDVVATGVPASPGAAVGTAVFTADEAEARAADGTKVILVRTETSPDDLHGMLAAQAILTSHGGSVSHAAVVARGIGKPAVCGVQAMEVDEDRREARIGDLVIHDGDLITLDGTEGAVIVGEVPVIAPEPLPEVQRILGWADGIRRLGVRANADLAEDARRARERGAEGIGLCRTEHQFLGANLPVVQRMILADTEEEEVAALAELHDVQLADFTALLEAMDGLPVTVRLLDPPLHEFLPSLHELEVEAATTGLDEHKEKLLHAVRLWAESNPMLGVRGVRLSVLKPHLYEMQVRALMEAAVERRRVGGDPKPQIMIPLTVDPRELGHAVAAARLEAQRVLEAANVDVDYYVGTMIETPRAALLAGPMAEHAEFFSFGTNDLTQMTFGFSRDDVEGRLMAPYLEQELLDEDPFVVIDEAGVGQLMQMTVEHGRAANPEIEMGICGEHGGEPRSVAFCHRLGLDYVSCSPFRVPTARLAAAHAVLAEEDATDADR